MLANPKPGDLVRVQYRKALHPLAPLQGAVGVVAVVSKGKPRNHGVRVGDRLHVIPCGHLVKLGRLAHLFDWSESVVAGRERDDAD